MTSRTRSTRSRLTPLALLAVALLLASTPAPPVAAQGGVASATFEDQLSGGTTVTVDTATLPDGGFLAIHDASLQDGAVLASVVGASSFLAPGTHEDVRVHLDVKLGEDTTLIAMPHKDSNGDQVYSFTSSGGSQDGPYTDGGDPVVDDASITVSATATMDDQPTDGSSVLVDRVELSNGGFVAIHDDRLLSGMPIASVIGVSGYLDAGVHEDVRVALDRDIMNEQTLIAMPHKDTNDDESYDFVTSGGTEDGFYADGDGGPVIDDATVSPSATASATYQPQATGGHTLHVESVFLPEGGFVTMHDSSLADGQTFESVRGTSECLDPGLHHDVWVSLGDPLNADDTMIAMPHQDTDDDCTYDFVTSDGADDGPYTDGDDIVTDSADTVVSASVRMSPSSSDGRTITVDAVDLSDGGFIAVHDPSLLAGAVTGSVVGTSSYLEAGAHEDVEITLDDPIRTSQTLIPMPHRDTNGNQIYDFVTRDGQADGPYVDGDGNPVIDTAHTIVQATVTLEAQSTRDTVAVASSTMHDGGFVVIHDASLLEGEVLSSVIGVSSKLSPGTHDDIVIQLDDVPDGEVTLIAMPHKDTDHDGTYDFVTSEGSEDGPYIAGGGAVVHAASIQFLGGPDGGGPGDGGGNGGSDDGEAPAPSIAFFGTAAALGLAGLMARRRRGG